MASGKNKLVRYLRVYVDGYDLSGNARTFSSMDNSFGVADMTVWNNAVKKMLPDKQRRVGIRGFQTLLDDTTDAGSLPVLQASYTNPLQVTFAFGGLAEPQNGDPAYFLNAVQMSDRVQPITAVHLINTNFLPDAVSYADQNPMGNVLQGATSLTSTTQTASIDNGAGTTDGFHSNLHVLATAGGASWTLEIEHSTDNAAWSQLALFAADGSTITSEYASGTGTVNRYVRFSATRTNGTITVVCVFSRGQ